MTQYSVLGKPLPRVDGIPKATGEGKYAADLTLPGMLWGKLLRSTLAHARILNIDTSRAKRLPGVKAVITGKDLGGFTYGFIPTTRDESPLCPEKVRFMGEELAAVAAVDEDTAEEACSLIKVDYEPLPAVFDVEEALKPGAPQIHEHAPGNVSLHYKMNFGDVEGGFKQSEYVMEDRFQTPRVYHAMLEPHATLTRWESNGDLTVWASKQSPYFMYRIFAAAFNLPQHRVRIIQPYIGAGYGAKNDAFPLDFASVVLAKQTGKPVKIVYSQKEMLTSSRRRLPFTIDIKTGVKADGTIMAQDIRVIGDGGAYTLIGPITMYLAGAVKTLPYKIRNYRYDGIRAYTNLPACSAHRGHGLAHTHFAGEIQLDMIAEALGMDPLEIRLKNAVDPGYVTPNGLKVGSCGLKECLEKVRETTNWNNRHKRPVRQGNIARGIGVSATTYLSGMRIRGHSACAATIKVHEDGTVSLLTGATDAGQGSDTVLAMIAAEELGVGLDDINVSLLDTQTTPADPGTYSSRVTTCAGPAVKLAAQDARKQLAEVAAEMLGTDLQDVGFKDHRVFVKSNPRKEMAFKRLTRAVVGHGLGKVILGRGYYGLNVEVPDFETGMGNISPCYSFGAQVSEVKVDLETGKVDYYDTTAAHDCGFALNPMLVEGQVDGQVSAAQGQTMTESFIIDRTNGVTRNTDFRDYKMPRAADTPEIHQIHVETIDPEGPYGAKEASEAIMVSTYPSIVSAIYNATGVWIKDLIVTPEKVLKALKEQKGRSPLP
ncbi:MAG: molybdopterin-dependent oxidoreductase [Chloroflexi bacterium]|nr:molybdopterin-dependent oxidoreductase [Chloroflexota bacterium]